MTANRCVLSMSDGLPCGATQEEHVGEIFHEFTPTEEAPMTADKLPPCPLCGETPTPDGMAVSHGGNDSQCPLSRYFWRPFPDEWRKLAAVDLREEVERLRSLLRRAVLLVAFCAPKDSTLVEEIRRAINE